MKRVYIIVEGSTEREFVSRILAPYFAEQGISISSIPILKSGGGMGHSNLEHFKNNIKPLLYEKDFPVVTTFVDLFRFPVQSSDVAEEVKLKAAAAIADVDDRIVWLETILNEATQKIRKYDWFVPYVQKHEFEALLFSDSKAFDYESEKIKKEVEAIIAAIPNPEDINTTPDGHPAERLKTVFKKHGGQFNKGADAVDFAELIGLEKILEKCPRFRGWIETLLTTAKGQTFQ